MCRFGDVTLFLCVLSDLGKFVPMCLKISSLGFIIGPALFPKEGSTFFVNPWLVVPAGCNFAWDELIQDVGREIFNFEPNVLDRCVCIASDDDRIKIITDIISNVLDVGIRKLVPQE